MALSDTQICNMALARIGAKRINNLAEESIPAIQCRIHYEPTRDAVLRSAWWVFASDRATLSQDAEEDPPFEWDNQFILPTDYLRFKSVQEDDSYSDRIKRHDIEGDRYLTNFSTVNLRYIKRVEDETKFDPLFVDAFVLLLAKKLASPLSGANTKLQELLGKEFDVAISKARVVNNQEADATGRNELGTWNDARY